MKHEITTNQTLTNYISLDLDSSLIDSKMSYADSIFLNNLLKKYIEDYINEVIENNDDLADEALHYLIEGYKTYKTTDYFDYQFKREINNY